MLIINIANDYQSHLLSQVVKMNQDNIKISKLLIKDIEITNPNTKVKHEIVLEGLESFLG